MSRGSAAVLTAIGAIAGAIVGLPYLDDGAACSNFRNVECVLDKAYVPFVSAVAIGMVVALAVGLTVRGIVRRMREPASARRQTRRAAVEVDDPWLQLATWGLAPHGRISGWGSPPSAEGPAGGPGRDSRPTNLGPRYRRRSGSSRLGSRGRPVPAPRRAG